MHVYVKCKDVSDVLGNLVEDYVEDLFCPRIQKKDIQSSFYFTFMTFNNHFSISDLRDTLSFCQWCLKHLLFGPTDKR